MGYSVPCYVELKEKDLIEYLNYHRREIRRRAAVRCIEDESFSHWKFSDALVN